MGMLIATLAGSCPLDASVGWLLPAQGTLFPLFCRLFMLSFQRQYKTEHQARSLEILALVLLLLDW